MDMFSCHWSDYLLDYKLARNLSSHEKHTNTLSHKHKVNLQFHWFKLRFFMLTIANFEFRLLDSILMGERENEWERVGERTTEWANEKNQLAIRWIHFINQLKLWWWFCLFGMQHATFGSCKFSKWMRRVFNILIEFPIKIIWRIHMIVEVNISICLHCWKIYTHTHTHNFQYMWRYEIYGVFTRVKSNDYVKEAAPKLKHVFVGQSSTYYVNGQIIDVSDNMSDSFVWNFIPFGCSIGMCKYLKCCLIRLRYNRTINYNGNFNWCYVRCLSVELRTFMEPNDRLWSENIITLFVKKISSLLAVEISPTEYSTCMISPCKSTEMTVSFWFVWRSMCFSGLWFWFHFFLFHSFNVWVAFFGHSWQILKTLIYGQFYSLVEYNIPLCDYDGTNKCITDQNFVERPMNLDLMPAFAWFDMSGRKKKAVMLHQRKRKQQQWHWNGTFQ